ncbi:hypothetical protein TWF569_001690 [Orbilia oligospora]|uniref:B30.2/SPRY domain-containing protein n=1 Tax=Orbilia oligospora TaxID=2813651 RepID=A0A7C8NIY6_ORBOL|nr:hypothetical protein TWF102_001024 [Orbilia oligospora]KAF3123602.1 hypothetical protein TWF569_001690 [Orbilia oligospora]KAF3132222.1 hypothetical protein TWF703_007340 [Orbilia oligospora]
MDNDTNENDRPEDDNSRYRFKPLSLGAHDNGAYIICLIGFKNTDFRAIESSNPNSPETQNLSNILPHLIPEALVFESPSFETRESASQKSSKLNSQQENQDFLSTGYTKTHSETQEQDVASKRRGAETTRLQKNEGHLKPQDSSESRILLQSNSIEIEAVNLLESLRIQFCRPGQPWKKLVLAGYGIWGIILKRAVILANQNPFYYRIALQTSTLVFFATPHQVPEVEAWENVLLSIIQSCNFKTDERISNVLSGLSTAAKKIHSKFYDILQKYMLINVIEGKGVNGNELPLVGELGSFGGETESHHVEWRKEQSLTTILRFNKHSLDDLDFLRKVFLLQDPRIMDDTLNGIKTTFLRDESSYDLYLQFLRIVSPSRCLIWEPESFLVQEIDLSDIYSEYFTTLEMYDWRADDSSSEIQIIGPPNYGKSHLLKHACQQVKRRTARVLVQYILEPNRDIDASNYGMLVALLHQVISQRPDLFFSIEKIVEEYFLWGTWTETNLWELLSILITNCPSRLSFAVAVDFKQFKEGGSVMSAWLNRLGTFFDQHSTNFLYIFSSENIIQTENLTSSISRVVLNLGSEVVSERHDRFAELALEQAIKHSPRLKLLEDRKHIEIRLALRTKLRTLDLWVAAPDFYAQILSLYTPRILTPSTIIDGISMGPSSIADLRRHQVQRIKECGEFVADWCSLGIFWVLKAVRPFRLEELSIALAIDLTDDSLENLDRRISRDLSSDLTEYAGLFLKVENDQIHTVCGKYQLEKILEEADPEHSLKRINHTQLTKLCLHYLRMVLSRPEAGKEWEHCLIHLSSPWQHPTSVVFASHPRSMGFLDYAVRNWIEHYRQANLLEATNGIHAEVIEFLNDSLVRDRWLQAYHSADSRRGSASYTATLPFEVEVTNLPKFIGIASAIEVAEYFGFTSLVDKLSKDVVETSNLAYNIRIQNGYRVRTQLFKNISSEEFIRALICNGKISQFKDFIETKQPMEAKLLVLAIHLAVQSGRLDLLDLLPRAECSSKIISESESYVTIPERNILLAAIISGSSSIVEYILKYKNVRDYVTLLGLRDWELDPLLCLELDNIPVLAHIKEIVGRNSPPSPNTALEPVHKPALRRFYFIEKFLGAKPSPIDSEQGSWTSLHFAVGSESFEVVQFVLRARSRRNEAVEFINQKTKTGWTALHIAAALGDANVVEELLRSGANANIDTYIQNTKKETPAEVAVKHGHLQVLKHLLPRADEDRISLLQIAARAGQLLIVDHLLDWQGDQSNPDTQNLYKAALIEAAKCGYSEIVRVLLSAKVEPNGEVGERRTALHYAAQEDHPEVAKILIAHGANVNSPDSTRNTPLHLATMHDGYDVVRVLVENEADVNAENRSKVSPLHLAISRPEIVTLLLNNGADVNAKDSRGRSPLIAACMAETPKPKVVKLLLEAGADTATADLMGNTAVYHAIKNDHFDIVRLTCENDRYAEEFQQTLVQKSRWAVEFSRTPMLEYFLERALELQIDITSLRGLAGETLIHALVASPEFSRLFPEWEPKLQWSRIINEVDNDGCTALYDSACYTKLDTARTLLSIGADINLGNENGWTPLHAAYDSAEFSELLISDGADINALNSSHHTPLMLACLHGFLATVKVLLKHRPKLELEDLLGYTALHLSASGGQYDITKLLLEDGGGSVANISMRDKAGNTPLHLAIKQDHPTVVELLIQKGSDIGAKTDLDETCLDLAMQPAVNPNGELLRILLARDKTDNPPLWMEEDLGRLVAKHFDGGLDQRIFPILEAEPGLLTSGVLDPLLLGLMHSWQEFEDTQETIALELLDKGFDPFKTRVGSKLSVFQSAFILREKPRQKFIDACMAKLPQNIEDCGSGFRELRTAIEYRDRLLWRQFLPLLDSASKVRDEDGWTLDHFIYQSQVLDSQPLVKSDRIPESLTITPKSLTLPDIWRRWNRRRDLDVGDRFDISDNGLVVTFTDGNRRDEYDHPTYFACSLRSDHPFPPRDTEKSYFEIEIQSIGAEGGSELSTVLIGLCGELSFLANAGPGWNVWTLGYHGDDGGMFEEHGNRYRHEGTKFGIGNTVGCGVDYELGDYYFTLDGKIEARFKGDNQFLISRKLYPVVGHWGRACKVLVNFGQKPFKWTGLEKRQLERRPTFAKSAK